ncbi:MAG: hypothetical protein PVH50_01335 [Anaerolineae bacterium]|jgi:hypothetical protein
MDREELVVRRAKAGDAERVSGFLNRALGGRMHVDPIIVTERLGDVGILLAEQGGMLRGLMGWNVENLVVCVTDMLIWPAGGREWVGDLLFEEMEASATELEAEAALLLPPRPCPPELLEYCQSLGYELRTVGELPRTWREMAQEAGRDAEGHVLVKRLRSDRVVRPL